MADTSTPPPPSSTATSPPSSAAEQARIRKERREAKIRAGGSARLNKITGLGGGIQRDPPPQPNVSEKSPHADPDEVDISEHYYSPNTTARVPQQNNGTASPSPFAGNDDALRQLMLGFDPAATAGNGTPPSGANPFNPFAGFPGMEGLGGPGQGAPGQEDPMTKLLQQMMGGGMPGEGANGMPSFPGMAGQPANTVEADPYAYIWRILHAVFALSLGLYIAFTTTFSGTEFDRKRNVFQSSIAGDASSTALTSSSIRFFYIFATAEVLLQSSRFWFEKGRVQQGGILGTVMGFLPQPYKGYLALILRYSRIWTTVSADTMAIVFVLGVCAWLRGGNAA